MGFHDHIAEYIADVKSDEERLHAHKKLCIHLAFIGFSLVCAVMLHVDGKVVFFTTSPLIQEMLDFKFKA
jgi:hypothetical protein